MGSREGQPRPQGLLLDVFENRQGGGPGDEVARGCEWMYECGTETEIKNSTHFTFLLALKNDASKASSASIWFSCSLMYCVKTV